MVRYIARTFVPLDEFVTLLAGIPVNEEPEVRIEGNRAIGISSNGVRTEFAFEDRTAFSVRFTAFDIYGPDGAHLFSIPNFNLTQKAFDANPRQTLQDYFAQFDGVTLEYSDAGERFSGDDFFSGGVSSALSSTSTLADALFRELAERSLIVDFGGGSDTLTFDASRSDVSVSSAPRDAFYVTTPEDDLEVRNLERIELTDGAFIFDEDGAYALYTYALYTAALARSPDEDGFRFWNGIMNSGDFDQATRQETEVRLAEEFVKSDEFNERFDVGTTDGFVTALYQNVLGRDPDQPGFEFWTGIFDTGEQGRDDMLRYFAVSEENMMPLTIEGAADGAFWVV